MQVRELYNPAVCYLGTAIHTYRFQMFMPRKYLYI